MRRVRVGLKLDRFPVSLNCFGVALLRRINIPQAEICAHVGGIGAPLFGFLAEGVGLATAFNWIGIAFVAMSGISLVIGRRFAR